MRRLIISIAFFVSLMLIYNKEQYLLSFGILMLPDMQMTFDISELKYTLLTLHEKARVSYLQYLLIDCLFTVLFAFIQNGMLRNIIKTSERFKRWEWALSFAQMRAGFDLLENIIYASLVLGTLVIWPFGCILAKGITSIKFFMFGLWMMSLLMLSITAVLIKMKGDRPV